MQSGNEGTLKGVETDTVAPGPRTRLLQHRFLLQKTKHQNKILLVLLEVTALNKGKAESEVTAAD